MSVLIRVKCAVVAHQWKRLTMVKNSGRRKW